MRRRQTSSPIGSSAGSTKQPINTDIVEDNDERILPGEKEPAQVEMQTPKKKEITSAPNPNLLSPAPRLSLLEQVIGGPEQTPMRIFEERRESSSSYLTPPSSPLSIQASRRTLHFADKSNEDKPIDGTGTSQDSTHDSEISQILTQNLFRLDVDNPEILTQETLPAQQQKRENIYLICLQHGLDTTASLLEALVEKGLSPIHIYFLDKLYSTNEISWRKIVRAIGKESNTLRIKPPPRPWLYGTNFKEHVRQLYARIISDIQNAAEKPSKIIVLDDGGRMIAGFPKELLAYGVYGIEQTTAGYRRLKKHQPPFPWISVATSKVKRREDPLIGENTEQRIMKLLPTLVPNLEPQNMRCGIVGLGHIGMASMQAIQKCGCQTFFYEVDDKITLAGATKCANVGELITRCNFIIGSTGKNTLKGIDIAPLITEDKYFMSISSEAIEFKSLMQRYENSAQNMGEYGGKTFVNLKYEINGHIVSFVNAGYPVNFNPQEQHAVAAEKIALTRTALSASVVHWFYHRPSAKDKEPDAGKDPIPWNEELQDFIVEKWSATQHPK